MQYISCLALSINGEESLQIIIVFGSSPKSNQFWLYTLERRWLRGDMIEMFKIMKGTGKISADELFSRVGSDRARGQSLRVKMVVRQGSFTQSS